MSLFCWGLLSCTQLILKLSVQATKFTGQGAESDYQVSGLFHRDFAFNQLADHEPLLQLLHRRNSRKSLL